MNSDLQRAQDLLTAMQTQRDQALNANVHAQAEISRLARQVADLEDALKNVQHERDKLVLDLKDAQDNLTAAALPAAQEAA